MADFHQSASSSTGTRTTQPDSFSSGFRRCSTIIEDEIQVHPPLSRDHPSADGSLSSGVLDAVARLGLDASIALAVPATPLFRSASAPPDYIPSPPASRQHRNAQHRDPLSDAAEFQASFPLPPEVVVTRRRDKECSACCLRCLIVVTTLRWVLVAMALLGACCVVAGIAFGVMSSALDKNTFFILAFTFIGIGIILVMVVGVGWRCSPVGHEPCHALCHLNQVPSGANGGTAYEAGTTHIRRLTQRSRNQWFGGFLYPEFQYGTPPPSYSTSMQHYRQQQLQPVVQLHGLTEQFSNIGNGSFNSLSNLSILPNSPPPTYRSARVSVPPRPRPSLTMFMSSTTSTEVSVPPPPYRSNSMGSSLDGLGEATAALESAVATECETADITGEPVVSPIGLAIEIPTASSSEVVEVHEEPQETSHIVPVDLESRIVPPYPEDFTLTRPSVRSIVRRYEAIGQEEPPTVANCDSLNIQLFDSRVQSDIDSIATPSAPTPECCRSKNGTDGCPTLQVGSQDQSETTEDASILCSANQKDEIGSSGIVDRSDHSHVDVIAFADQSQTLRSGHLPPTANQVQVSDSANPTYKHDFARSQSLEDNEPGQSGI